MHLGKGCYSNLGIGLIRVWTFALLAGVLKKIASMLNQYQDYSLRSGRTIEKVTVCHICA